MNHLKPSIRVRVDVTNPGQFFACCGLLELADRLWPGAEVLGHFTPQKYNCSRFTIFSNRNIETRELVKALCECDRLSVDPHRLIMGSDGKPVKDAKKTMPVQLNFPRDGAPAISLRLSWWIDEIAGKQLEFKTWGSHQTSHGLINDLAKAIRVESIDDKTVLEYSIGMTGRIGLDPRSSWNALDEGFSPNNQGLPVETYPATELLAAVGLQTFTPASHEASYIYTCWTAPLPAIVGRAAVCGCTGFQGDTRYRFMIGNRGKFKYFTKSTQLERNTNGRN